MIMSIDKVAHDFVSGVLYDPPAKNEVELINRVLECVGFNAKVSGFTWNPIGCCQALTMILQYEDPLTAEPEVQVFMDELTRNGIMTHSFMESVGAVISTVTNYREMKNAG